MTLLNPWALAFAGAVPIIVLLYLLKVRRRSVDVSTLMFWQQVLQEKRRRALFQRLRNWLSLLLHLLIFLLILFALAKPEWDGLAATGSSTVLIIDSRARMQARTGGEVTRIESAKQLALGFIRRAAAGNEFAILSAHATVDVVVPFTTAEAPLRKGLEELDATDAAGDLEDAVRLAERLLTAHGGRRRIIVFSDPASAAAVKSTEPIEFVPTGQRDDNVAITRFAARALPASPQTAEVMLEVRNFAAAPAAGLVEITCDGSLLDVRRFELKGGEGTTQLFSIAPSRHVVTQGRLVATLGNSDALAIDNTAYAILPGSQPHRVLLVSRKNWFLEKVFAADDRVQFELLTPESFRPELAESFDAVVFDDSLPADFDLETAEGNYLFVKKMPWAQAFEPLEMPPVTDIDALHPLMRLVGLQDVRFLRATQLGDQATIAGWKLNPIVRSFEHPLVVSATRQRPGKAEQRFVATAFDVAESDLPLRVAFPLFISNTVRWLAGEQTGLNRAPLTGEVIALAPAQLVKSVELPVGKASGSDAVTMVRGGTFRPLKNGFYVVSETGKSDTYLAANTFSPDESNLVSAMTRSSAGDTELTASSFFTRGSAPAFVWHRPFWQFLALAALLLFTAEWWLYHQRRTE